jgi:hypothetical protein
MDLIYSSNNKVSNNMISNNNLGGYKYWLFQQYQCFL